MTKESTPRSVVEMGPTSVIQKGLKTNPPCKGKDSNVSQKWGKLPCPKDLEKDLHYIWGKQENQKVKRLVAFCSPAKSLTLSGFMENPLVGKKLKS